MDGTPRRRRRMRWGQWEHLLLVVFLASKVWALAAHWGQMLGHDAAAQLEVTGKLSWNHLTLGIQECFNCYQPPLGFLIPKLFEWPGVSPTLAAQLATFTASLLSFFLLRATLRFLGLLHRPAPLAFLYVSSSIPVQLYLTVGISLDAFMHLWASALLYLSVRLFWVRPGQEPTVRQQRVLLGVLVLVLLSGTLVKYSGFVLFSVPCLVAAVQPRDGRWFRRGLVALAACGVAGVLVLPYYYTRYYQPLGKLFPVNNDWMVAKEMDEGRAKRDADRLGFFVELFKPTPTAEEHPDWNDTKVVRMHDTWRFFWVRSHVLGWGGDRAFKVSKFYIAVMPWLLLVGTLCFLRRARRGVTWIRWGWLMLAIGAVEVGAMVQYLYGNPYAWWVPVKAFYISPTCWTLAYLLSGLMGARFLAPFALARRWRLAQQLLLVAVAVFTFVNHTVGIF